MDHAADSVGQNLQPVVSRVGPDLRRRLIGLGSRQLRRRLRFLDEITAANEIYQHENKIRHVFLLRNCQVAEMISEHFSMCQFRGDLQSQPTGSSKTANATVQHL